MSKYTGEFLSINNTPYKIEITTASGTTNKSVILGETPLVVTGSENDFIYEPVKSTGATVTLLTNSFIPELYSGSALGTSVKVTSGNSVVWVGYLTPCAYTQAYDAPLESLELECVDGLSVLQDIPYQSDKEITNFLSVIFKCLNRAKCFKYLFVCDTIQFTSTGTENILTRLRISEQNFYDEKDYETQPDNEVAWSCYDVLSEIMKYMGYTMAAYGEDVYIIDYDAIIQGRNKYYRYDIATSSSISTSVNLSHTHKIVGTSFAETGNSITLSKIYNQLSVKDDFYEIESIVEGVDNSKNWINITDTSDAEAKKLQSSSKYGNMDIINGNGEYMFIGSMMNDGDIPFFVIMKFYENPLIKTYHYSLANNSKLPDSQFNPMNFTKLRCARGAYLVGEFVKDIDKNKYNDWSRTVPGWERYSDEQKLQALGKLMSMQNIESRKLTNYIVCLNQSQNHIEHDKVKDYPYFTISKNVPNIFGGAGGYIIITGSLLRHDQENFPFSFLGKQGTRKNTSIYAGESYFWAQIKWGNQYYTEENYEWGNWEGHWTDKPSYFKIWYGDPSKEQKSADFFDKELSIYNTAKKVWGLDENGFYIPAPEDGNLSGNIEFTIYANKDTKGKKDVKNGKDKKNSYDTYRPRVVLFKDLDLKLVYSDDSLNDESASEDTVYVNEVEKYENINPADEESFKICTFDEKTPSYSTVDYLDQSGNSQYLDKTYNLATNQSLRQEEHYITRFVSQYEEPRIEFECNLKNDISFKPYSVLESNQFSGKKFIIDSYTTDYRFNKTTLKIVEKNNKYA